MHSPLSETRRPWLLPAILAVAVAVTLVRLALSLPNYAFVMHNHTSGTWATLADDLAHGTLYRPIVSELGYGGTRYFPLHIALHAALIKAGLPVLWSGHLIGAASVLALIGAVIATLRQLGASRRAALVCGGLLLATTPVQMALTRVGSEALAIALSAWGVAAMARFLGPDRRARWLLLGSAAFILAFFAKQTCLSGVAAAGMALLLARRIRPALGLAALVGAGMVGGILLVDAASGGNVIQSGTLAKGEIALGTLLSGPLRLFARILLSDPAGLVALVLSVVLVVRRRPEALRELHTLFLVFTLLNLMLLFGQPGTETNHLIELGAASLLCLGAELERGRVRAGVAGGVLAGGAVVGVALIAAVGLSRPPWQDGPVDNREALARILSASGPRERGPILSENPWVPLLAGERPFALDPMAVRQLNQNWPEFRKDLFSRLEGRAFRAVLLQQDVAKEREWYETVHMGPGFVDKLLESYEPAGQQGLFYVYLPKAAPAAPGPQP